MKLPICNNMVLVQKVRRVHKDLPDHRGIRDPLGLPDHKAQVVMGPDQWGRKDHKGTQDHRETQDQLDPKGRLVEQEIRVLPDPQAQPVLQVRQGQPEQMGRMAQPDPWDPLDLRVQQGLPVQMGPMGLLVGQEIRVLPDQRGRKAFRVLPG